MHRAVIILSAILLLSASCMAQITMHFEGPTNNSVVTTNNLNASISGSNTIPGLGNWRFDAGAEESTLTTNHYFFTTSRPFVGANGLAMSMLDPAPASDFKLRLPLGRTVDEWSFGFYIEENITQSNVEGPPDSTGWDHVLFEDGSGHYRIVQRLVGYSPADSYETHTSHADGAGNRVISPAGRHWITGYGSRASGKFAFEVYDADTHQRYGTNSIMNMDDFGIIQISFSTYGHGYSAAATNIFDNFVFFTNSTSYPYLPWATDGGISVRSQKIRGLRLR